MFDKLITVENKIDKIGRMNAPQETCVQLDPCKVPPPPPNPEPKAKQFKVNSDNLRRDLMNELKDIMDKRGKKN